MRLAKNTVFYPFHTQYEVVAKYAFGGGHALDVTADHEPTSARTCRYCPHPKSFNRIAHAAPQLLGNSSLVSPNECDSCNELFCTNCEAHLANWFGPARTLARIKGTSGVPGFENSSGTVIKEKKGHLAIDARSLTPILDATRILLDAQIMTSKACVPVRAAMALVKTACSIGPTSELANLQQAIAWITGRSQRWPAFVPVLFAIAPGFRPFGEGEVILLRRKTATATPYLWCIISSSHFRFQFSVPFCPQDCESRTVAANDQQGWHHRLPDGDAWNDTELYELDWSGRNRVRQQWTLEVLSGKTYGDLKLVE